MRKGKCIKLNKKIGVIGLGSMGKRRVRDLQKLGYEVIGFDIRKDRRSETNRIFGIQVVNSFTSLIKNNIFAGVISTPPDRHYIYYEKLFNANVNFFSEANIFTPKAEWFKKNESKYGIKTFPSATWKFHPSFKSIQKELIQNKAKINSIHYHYAGFLPFWHPYEDYTKFYAGKRKTSAAREMVPFELEAINMMMGKVEAVSAVKGKARKWKSNFDDYYFLQLKFINGKFGTLNIELNNVSPYRKMVVSCEDRCFEFDGSLHKVMEYDFKQDKFKIIKPTTQKTLGSFDFEEIYFNEIKNFTDSIYFNKNYCKLWDEDRHLSDVLYAAELSSTSKKWIYINKIKSSYTGILY